jgi:hypothetical protein
MPSATPRDRRAGAEHPDPAHRCPGIRAISAEETGGSGERAGDACIHAAKPHPDCRHRRQSRIPAAPSRAGQRAGGRGQRRSRSTGTQATSDPGRPSWRAAFMHAAKPHPCRPLTSGPADTQAGPAAIPLDRIAGDERPRPSGRRALIHAANPNPYRRPRRQAASLPPPSRAGQRAGGRGHRRSRATGMQATSGPGPLAVCLHPGCQSESLPPPSPPSCIPAAPSRAGQRAGGRGHRRSRSTGRQASPHPRFQVASR